MFTIFLMHALYADNIVKFQVVAKSPWDQSKFAPKIQNTYLRLQVFKAYLLDQASASAEYPFQKHTTLERGTIEHLTHDCSSALVVFQTFIWIWILFSNSLLSAHSVLDNVKIMGFGSATMRLKAVNPNLSAAQCCLFFWCWLHILPSNPILSWSQPTWHSLPPLMTRNLSSLDSLLQETSNSLDYAQECIIQVCII